jgi:hypothetical protein
MSDTEKPPPPPPAKGPEEQINDLRNALEKKADKTELAKKADKEEKTTFLGFDVTHFTQEWKNLLIEVVALKVAFDVFKFEIPSVVRFNEEALMAKFNLQYRQRGVFEHWSRMPADTQQTPTPPVNETSAQRIERLRREGQQAQAAFDRAQAQVAQLQQQSRTAMQQLQNSANGLLELEQRARGAADEVAGST